MDDLLANYAHPFAENDEKRKYPYSVGSNKSIKDILEELKCNPRVESGYFHNEVNLIVIFFINLFTYFFRQGLIDKYHEVQHLIIIGDHSILLQRLFEWTQDSTKNTKTTNTTNSNTNVNNINNVKSPEFLRFAAHVVLSFRYRFHSVSSLSSTSTTSSSPSSTYGSGSVWEADPRSDAVIEAYVRYLIDAKKVSYSFDSFFILFLFKELIILFYSTITWHCTHHTYPPGHKSRHMPRSFLKKH